jgi:glycosyltransferase involved in cell wall biosynthesis
MTALVSLIMTVYNRERYLSAAIESVLSQSFPFLELLIWDDGSTDSSMAIANHYAAQDGRIQVVAAPHTGRSAALKAATELTTGNYIGWIDSDDLLAATALEDTVAVLEHSADVGMVYTDHIVIDEGGAIQGYGERCRTPYSKERLLIDFMTFHFRLIRRSIYEQVGGVNDTFSCNIDQELCLRISEVTDIFHLKKPLYYYRYHRDSIASRQRIEQIFCAKRAIEEAMQRRGLTDNYELETIINAHFTLLQKQIKAVPEPAMPHIDSSSWAMHSDSLDWVIKFIREKRISSVAECGSGSSTFAFANCGLQSLLSLEHDERWLEHTRTRLEEKNLKSQVDLKLCPLRPTALNGFIVDWYDTEGITPFPADLVLVDGPPGNNKILSRYPAPHLLKAYFKPGTWLILDDWNRLQEKEVVKLWLREIPELKSLQTLETGTGLAVMQYTATQ